VQATCRFQGRFAEELVRRRDIERVTRTEALANFDRALQSPYGTEQDKATIAIYRQLAVQVYAHRAWTLEDARTYGEQECLRSNTR
jgi:hypothetical protein